MRRALGGTAWLVAARLLGVGWRAVLVWQLGFAAFGQYAVAMAAATLLAVPLDSSFVVRAPRVSDDEFRSDRATRWWVGAVVVAVGGALWAVSSGTWPLAGLAVAKAGADVAFNAMVAPAMRSGRPDLVYGIDASRQLAAVAVAGGWLLLGPDPTIGSVAGIYVLGVVAFAAPGLLPALGTRPSMPEPARARTNIAEAVGGALYTHGDVVLLGVLAGSAAAGQYSFGVMAVGMIGLVAQNYVVTFHESLRAARGEPGAGPRPLRIALLSVSAGAAMLAGGAALAIAGADRGLWACFLVLSVVGVTRVWSAVCATILAIQRRDRFRLRLTLIGVGIKGAVLVTLGAGGSVAAAAAFVIADIVVAVGALGAVYRGYR